MVIGGCLWALPVDAESFWRDVQEDYRAVGYEGSPPPPPQAIGPWHFPDEATAFFEEVAANRYPFQVVYSAEDYLANLATQSGTRRLGEERRRDFLSRVRARLGSWPRVTANLVGFQTVRRRIAGPPISETAAASNLSYLDAVQASLAADFSTIRVITR